MARTILVVEDDPDIVKVVRVYLEGAGYAVHPTADGESGLRAAREVAPALVILDWMLPGMDGPTFMRKLRGLSETPVIMLTAKGEETDRLTGFSAGVDDYIVKPFSPRELVARVKAVLARSKAHHAPGERVRRFGDLSIDPERRSVRLGEHEVELTTREFDLLAMLARHPRRVFTRDELLERIWGDEYIGIDRVVDVHVSHLRAKLEPEAGGTPHYIQTVRGVGYRFAVEEDEDEHD